MFLQASSAIVEKTTSILPEYGVLGLFATLMLVVVIYMEKQRASSIASSVADMRATIVSLTAKVNAQQQEQESQQKAHIQFITNEYRQNQEVMAKCVEILSEVKHYLKHDN